MSAKQRLPRIAKRDATLLFWASSTRYAFILMPRIALDGDEHSTIFDSRWLCLGVNAAFVDDGQVSRASRFCASKRKTADQASR
jgi:hypothetical protein